MTARDGKTVMWVRLRASVKKLWSHKEKIVLHYSPEQLGVDRVYADHKYSQVLPSFLQ